MGAESHDAINLRSLFYLCSVFATRAETHPSTNYERVLTTKYKVYMSTSIPLSCQALFESLNMEIENHLTDANFDVGKLLRPLGMSRTDLHRKLGQCVGMSTTWYIRYVRV